MAAKFIAKECNYHTRMKTQLEILKKEYIKSVSDNIENRMSTETAHTLSAF